MTVIVGAGTAGCVLAARLSEDPTRQVLVIDAGPDLGDHRAPVRLPAPATAGTDWIPAELGRVGSVERPTELVRGVQVGGSAEVNGGYFIRPRRADVEAWYPGSALWTWDGVLESMRRIEHDHDYGEQSDHGRSGPIQVTRGGAGPPSGLASAFTAAAIASGLLLVPDLNGPEELGVGPVPRNVIGGHRSTPAGTYMVGARSRANLRMLTETIVERLLFDDELNIVGVAVRRAGEPTTIPTDSVVLSAGAIGSAALLMRSGIGPADILRAAGVEVLLDRPEIGSSISEHPAVELPFVATIPPSDDAPYVDHVVHRSVGRPGRGRTVEVMLTGQSYGRSSGVDLTDDLQALRVAHMEPRSRGSLRITGPGTEDPLDIELGLLGDTDDVDELVEAVRDASVMAAASPLAHHIADWRGPHAATVADDAALRKWVVDHLTTCQHLSSTVPMGVDGALDDRLSLRGAGGVHVVDTAALPVVPSRGTALTAVLLGEHAAALLP